jgi:PAS domain S-box-containing protein
VVEVSAPDRVPEEELASLRHLVEQSSDMLARHDPDGTFRYVSPVCRELIGFGPEELVGRSPYELVHPDDVVDVEASHAGILEDPHLRAVEYRLRHRDGHDVWVETTGHTVRDPTDGEVVEIHTSTRDIGWRRAAAIARREEEERFRLAMANAPIGMAIVGLDGSWVAVNERLCELLGRPARELLELTFQDLTHPDDLDTDLGYATQLLEGEIAHYEMEKRYLRPSGEVVWALLSGSVVRDPDGTPCYFIAQIVDITQRKRAQLALERTTRELERSNAELERYAAVAAHDLRSPLATIGGFLELLGQQYGPALDEQGRRIVAVARGATTQMAETVEGLLTLARITTDVLDEVAVDVEELIAEVAAAIGPELEAAGADLRIGPLPVVRGDRTQLRLLFQNLLQNAARFGDPARSLEVSVTAERAGARWRFVVADNGRGFASDDTDHLFEPFARTPEGARLGSTGLGLATCRRVVERHGGSITARSASPGARLVFTLPDGTR